VTCISLVLPGSRGRGKNGIREKREKKALGGSFPFAASYRRGKKERRKRGLLWKATEGKKKGFEFLPPFWIRPSTRGKEKEEKEGGGIRG